MKTSFIIPVFLLSILCAFGISCSNNKAKPANSNAENTEQVESSNVTLTELPGVPTEQLAHLWNNCEFVDYIFHNLPFSLSQSETPAIQANLNFISTKAAGKIDLKSCKPMGREFFQVNGEIVMEADVYYSPNCYFYVFVKDEKPIYANKISQSGMAFYHQITTQVSTQ